MNWHIIHLNGRSNQVADTELIRASVFVFVEPLTEYRFIIPRLPATIRHVRRPALVLRNVLNSCVCFNLNVQTQANHVG